MMKGGLYVYLFIFGILTILVGVLAFLGYGARGRYVDIADRGIQGGVLILVGMVMTVIGHVGLKRK